MTKFQDKRLKHIIKCADKCEYVQLNPGDADIFKILVDYQENAYNYGYQDGYQQYLSLPILTEEEEILIFDKMK